jgi:hypothetical protein
MESKIHKTAIILFLFNNAIHLQGVPKIKHNGLGLCVRAGNRSTKAGFITNVQLKNYR